MPACLQLEERLAGAHLVVLSDTVPEAPTRPPEAQARAPSNDAPAAGDAQPLQHAEAEAEAAAGAGHERSARGVHTHVGEGPCGGDRGGGGGGGAVVCFEVEDLPRVRDVATAEQHVRDVVHTDYLHDGRLVSNVARRRTQPPMQRGAAQCSTDCKQYMYCIHVVFLRLLPSPASLGSTNGQALLFLGP